METESASPGLELPEPAAPELRHDYSSLIGRSLLMMGALRLIDRATDVDAPVLLYGESGTGKEVVARCLHENGPRRASRFVAVNCAAIPETLLENELFGHGRGAFTGAHRAVDGLITRADRGTLFLDEIGDMSPAMQARLLRVLQEREVQPLGGGPPRRVDVRLVCATHRELPALVRAGSFREDLYYRIHVIRVELPPLRRRLDDLPSLCRHFLAPTGKSLSPAALERLRAYPWPGNVRELANVLERASVLAPGRTIGSEWIDLPDVPSDGVPASGTLRAFLERAERSYLIDVLRRSNGNRGRAAALLDIDRTTLYRMIKRHGL